MEMAVLQADALCLSRAGRLLPLLPTAVNATLILHCVSKNGPFLKRYSSRLYGSIGGIILKSLELEFACFSFHVGFLRQCSSQLLISMNREHFCILNYADRVIKHSIVHLLIVFKLSRQTH